MLNARKSLTFKVVFIFHKIVKKLGHLHSRIKFCHNSSVSYITKICTGLGTNRILAVSFYSAQSRRGQQKLLPITQVSKNSNIGLCSFICFYLFYADEQNHTDML